MLMFGIAFHFSFFLTLKVPSLNEANKDYYRQVKPILDEYQLEEFENKIHTAMEFASLVKFKVWGDGFDWEYTGDDTQARSIHQGDIFGAGK
ncbi:YolD-like family protein [Peribacillus sp. JNUCC41]|uniref:YolD-like family protein n=1 Tax=Peribacillus sp. JNUCC41 TaxID=2778370 RepID=UPI001785B1E9|nr:YolD-like family protein [Brevibacillus sp. JNUCC-41]QOS89250.1 YolD-like family protein [Brevibacillus sp. JNUCC-41]